MSFIDWFLVFVPLLLILGIGVHAQRHGKSVADFLSGRFAGLYVLAVSKGEMAAGAAVCAASFELTSKAVVTCIGFTRGGLRALFARLRSQTVNPLDDGTMVSHQNLDENVLSPAPPAALPAQT